MGIITLSLFIRATTITSGVEPRISRRGPEYFIGTLAVVFNTARDNVLRCSGEDTATALAEPDALRRLDPRARTVLALFLRTDRITAAVVAGALGLSDRMARVLLGRWVEDGWLEVVDPSRWARAYVLSAIHRKFIGNGWRVTATSVEADHHFTSSVTCHNCCNQKIG